MNAQADALAPTWDNPEDRFGTMFDRGDLVLVPFPFNDCMINLLWLLFT
jgi:hypothetical protein